MICNLGVVGSNPTRGSKEPGGSTRSIILKARKSREDRQVKEKNILGGFQSGQMGQTVNLLSFDFGGSNPSPPTSKMVVISRK